MRAAQDHARRTPRLQRFLPARCAQTPAITGLQSRKAEFRHRRREIIAAGLRELEKTQGHDNAHGVAADVLAAGVAAAVPKESRHRAQGADFESIADHVLGLLAPSPAFASVFSQHWNSLHSSLRRSDETPVIIIDIRVVNLPWVRMREPIGEQKLLDRDSFSDGRLKLPAPNGEQLAFRKRLCKPNEVQRT